MTDKFSVEEINLMCIYDISDKTALLSELKESLPDIYDPDMRDIYNSIIEKLGKMSDDDFSGIGFYIADEYIEETEA